MLSGRGLCDELITRPEESYRLCCVVVCDVETSRMGAPYIYDISRLRVNMHKRMTDRSDTWRLPFLRTSKIALNVCNELELAKHYDALGLHFNEHNNTDCVRTTFYCH